MNTLSHDSELIARTWLCESQGDPTTAGLRHAVMLLLEHAEAENKRLRAALKPFVDECEKTDFRHDSWNPDAHIDNITITIAEAREAADAAGGES